MKITITESQLRDIIAESIRKALTENSKRHEQSQRYLDFLEKEGYTEESIHKVAKDMAENGIESLKDGNREVLCIAFDQNDNLMYSLHQRGWRHVLMDFLNIWVSHYDSVIFSICLG